MKDRCQQTVDEFRQEMTERAAHSFKDHIMLVESTHPKARSWMCANPKSSNYQFRVIAIPNNLIVVGDIGDGVFEMFDDNPIVWLRKAQDSVDYMLGKIRGGHSRTQFLPAEAERWLDNLVTADSQDGVTLVKTLREDWNPQSDLYGDANYFFSLYFEVAEDCDVPLLCDYTSEAHLLRLALKKFISLLDASCQS